MGNIIYKVLGLGDLYSALVILLSGWLGVGFLIVAAKFLVIKGGIFAFTGDMASFVDVFIGVYVIVLSFGFSSTIISVIAAIFLIQKGILSLF